MSELDRTPISVDSDPDTWTFLGKTCRARDVVLPVERLNGQYVIVVSDGGSKSGFIHVDAIYAGDLRIGDQVEVRFGKLYDDSEGGLVSAIINGQRYRVVVRTMGLGSRLSPDLEPNARAAFMRLH